MLKEVATGIFAKTPALKPILDPWSSNPDSFVKEETFIPALTPNATGEADEVEVVVVVVWANANEPAVSAIPKINFFITLIFDNLLSNFKFYYCQLN